MEAMESWRYVWRHGFAPQATMESLEALRTALMTDDPKLLQGITTNPPPLHSIRDWECTGACLVGYIGWHNDYRHENTVGQVEESFAQLCYEADQRLGEPAACRWLLHWFDDTPRDEMRRELLTEVELELSNRRSAETMNS